MWNPGVATEMTVSLSVKEERLREGRPTFADLQSAHWHVQESQCSQNIQTRLNWNCSGVRLSNMNPLVLRLPPKLGANFRLSWNKTKPHSATYLSRSFKNAIGWGLTKVSIQMDPSLVALLFFKVESPQEMCNSGGLPRKKLSGQATEGWRALFPMGDPFALWILHSKFNDFVYVE